MKSSSSSSSSGNKKASAAAYAGAASGTNTKRPPPKMMKKKALPPPPVMFRLHSPQIAFGTKPAAGAAKEDADVKKDAEGGIVNTGGGGEKEGSSGIDVDAADNKAVMPAAVTMSTTEPQADNEAKSDGGGTPSKKSKKKKMISHVLIAEKGGGEAGEDLPAASSSVSDSVARPAKSTKKPTMKTTTIAEEPSSNPTASNVNDAMPKSSSKHKKHSSSSSSKKQEHQSKSTSSLTKSIIPSGLFDDSDSEEEQANISKRTKGGEKSSFKSKKTKSNTPATTLPTASSLVTSSSIASRTKKQVALVVSAVEDSKQQSSSSSSRHQSRSKSTRASSEEHSPPRSSIKHGASAPPEEEVKKETSSSNSNMKSTSSPTKRPSKKTRRDTTTVAKELISNIMAGQEVQGEMMEEEEKPTAAEKVHQQKKTKKSSSKKRKRGEDEDEEVTKVASSTSNSTAGDHGENKKENAKRTREEEEEEEEEDTKNFSTSSSDIPVGENHGEDSYNNDKSSETTAATTTGARRSQRSNMYRGVLNDASMDYQAIANAIASVQSVPFASSSSSARASAATITSKSSKTSSSTKKKKRPSQPTLSNPPPAPALKGKQKQVKKNHNTNKQVKLLSFEEKIALLQAHKDKYKSCDLKRAPKDEVHPTLFSFVNESRKQYKRLQRKQHTTMTQERVAVLEKMGFDFTPLDSGLSQRNREVKTQEQWEAKFNDLLEYREKNGDCLVSCLAEETLGNWVRRQRKLYNRIGRDGFPPERLARLEAIGFDFDPVRSGTSMAKKRAKMFPRVNANWEKHFNRLKKFKETNDHLVIGPNTKGWAGLYHWVHVQRKEHKKFIAGEDALMHPQWIAKMDDLGFNWAPMASENYSTSVMRRHSEYYNDVWNKHYQDLIRFLKKNKHFPTAKGHGELRNWLNDQRRHKRRNGKGLMTPLTDERIKLLNDVDFNWESNPPDGEAVDETKINAAWSSRLSLSHQSSDDVPEVDNSTSLDNVGQAADTSEMVQDYGMSDSNVRMEEDMVLGAGETEFTDMLQDDDEIATETAQV